MLVDPEVFVLLADSELFVAIVLASVRACVEFAPARVAAVLAARLAFVPACLEVGVVPPA